jgi:20S proteasome subunit alpha 4
MPRLFHAEPSGGLTAWKAQAIGKNSDKVLGLLETSYEDKMTYDKGVRLVIDSMLQYVESGSKNIEVAVMFNGQPMNIINDEDIDKIIAEIEEKKKREQEKK